MTLKERITLLDGNAHAIIGSILKKNGVTYSKNSVNIMVHFDKKHVSDKIIHEIKEFVDYCFRENHSLESNIYEKMRERVRNYSVKESSSEVASPGDDCGDTRSEGLNSKVIEESRV